MTNIDQQELDKFGKMATSWWDLEGDFKPIHQLNPLRLDYILRQARGLSGKSVLDVGCGGGILSESMAKLGAKVTGIDMSTAPLQVAIQHSQSQNLEINYQQITIEDFVTENPETKFDVITCMEMLEHVPDPQSIVQNCAKLLKPDGVLLISTINRTLKAWALVVIGAEYLLKLLPKGTHDYDKFIKPAELLAWADSSHLQAIDLVGYHYNPITGKFWLNQDVSANYIASFRKYSTE